MLHQTSEGLGGAPVIAAAHALKRWLESRDVQRLAIATPYPEWLYQAAETYWQQAGFEVLAREQVDIGGEDTYGIYRLQSGDARRALERLAESGADAVMISGTGMPSLKLLRLASELGVSAVSSNFATAREGLSLLGLEPVKPADWNLED